MSLSDYNKKRNFANTGEPRAKLALTNGGALSFVVQRHKASRLHYDVRLEMNGVLKSWAVPKGPSMNPTDKRLAVLVEDHPLDYQNFHGKIAAGNYGAGLVEIWDSGTYLAADGGSKVEDQKQLEAGLKKGDLKFILQGKKLKGGFALVKLKKSGDNSWLLIKHRDDFSVEEHYDSENLTPKNSPINKSLRKRLMPGEIDDSKKAVKAVKQTLSGKVINYLPAMLARQTDKPFDSGDWLFEIKWDGYRAIAEVDEGGVKLYSRNGNAFNKQFSIIAEALVKGKTKAIYDGEIVALNHEGKPDFQLLQHYNDHPDTFICYYVFDLLSLNGKSLEGLPLIERKKLLQQHLSTNPIIRYSDDVKKEGVAFYKVAKAKQLEGIMAKKCDSLYYCGKRSDEWLKIKNQLTIQVVIAGFTEPKGSRKKFGALVIGLVKEDELVFAGHTGGGFTDDELSEIYSLLQPLVTNQSPFKAGAKTNMPVTWVKPILECEVKYTEQTKDGRLRHPIFMRMLPGQRALKKTRGTRVNNKMQTEIKKVIGGKQTKKEVREKSKTVQVGKSKVELSNMHKIFFPGKGITKGNVIDYYDKIAGYLLPYLKGRPQTLLRMPNGIDDKGFYHKDAGEGAPAFVATEKVYSSSTKKYIDYIICNNKATLLYMANLGCIELNPWHSSVKQPDKPGYLIIDLDPSKNNTFNDVIVVARMIKKVFDKAGAESYCKTSGASGLHIYVPLAGKYTYDQVKYFAHLVCLLVNEQLPAITTLERSLRKRPADSIYLDHLQNRKGQTIAAVYSLRPTAAATVSTPLLWTEVKKGLTPEKFTIDTIFDRLAKKGDLFKSVLQKGIDLQKCLEKLSLY